MDYNKLTYYFKSLHTAPINFIIKHKGSFHIFKEIRDGDKTLKEIEQDQKKFKSILGQVASGDQNIKRIIKKML